MQKIKTLLFVLLLSFFLDAKPIVSVSIPPEAYFLKQIAGDSLVINTLIPQGADPHTFEFKPSNLYQLQKSDLYLTIGLEFEKIWLEKLKDNLKQTKIFSLTQNIPFEMEYEHKDQHEHNEHKDHDPHIWLSPALVKILANNIASILSDHYPQNKELYAKNLQNFLAKIDTLQKRINSQLSSLKNRAFLVYHPAWGYFAKEFQLKEIAIEAEGKEPSPQELANIISLAKKEKIRIIFVQNGFSSRSAEIIAKSSGATIWMSNPLAYEWESELLNFTQGLLH